MADYKKITNFVKHTKTPFLDELVEEIIVDKRTKIIAGKSPSLVVNRDTGEVEGTQVFAIHEKVDKERFTKIYEGGMRQLYKLSKSGLKVLDYFTTITKPNKGEVIFEMDACKEYCNYKTDKPILKGIAELIEQRFIARSKHYYKYYINPKKFFNGNRFAFIKMYELDESISSNKVEPNKSGLLE